MHLLSPVLISRNDTACFKIYIYTTKAFTVELPSSFLYINQNFKTFHMGIRLSQVINSSGYWTLQLAFQEICCFWLQECPLAAFAHHASCFPIGCALREPPRMINKAAGRYVHENYF